MRDGLRTTGGVDHRLGEPPSWGFPTFRFPVAVFLPILLEASPLLAGPEEAGSASRGGVAVGARRCTYYAAAEICRAGGKIRACAGV
jgi:hypothetical protein